VELDRAGGCDEVRPGQERLRAARASQKVIADLGLWCGESSPDIGLPTLQASFWKICRVIHQQNRLLRWIPIL
jgi:hypothetical protein